MEKQLITWEEGSALVSTGIQKIINRVEGALTDTLDVEEYMQTYYTICNMCRKSRHHPDYLQPLYDLYRKSLEDYNALVVLPALKKQNNEFMLREFVKRWENHKAMVQLIPKLFSYLERHFVRREKLLPLRDVGFLCFRKVVFNAHTQIEVMKAVFDLINREREGEQIDGVLLENIVNIYVEIGMEKPMFDYYKNAFEKPLLEDTRTYYARKAALWILQDSCPEYMLKVEECLKLEEDKVAHYLQSRSKNKLLEMVQNELLCPYKSQLLEKQDSGFLALIRDDKKNDVARLYRLFCRIPRSLEPVAGIFEQHITSQGIALVKWAEDAVNDKSNLRNVCLIQEHEFVQKLIEMHDKYMDYVENAFQNNMRLLKALKEAFVVICNKAVGGSTSAELLAVFCDNIVKKCGILENIDDQIESMLEKAIKLVEYVTDKDLFEEFCTKKLTHRLLFDRSANIDHEQKILVNLKQQCGSHFTKKMQVMVNDFIVSKELQAQLNFSENNLNITFAVTVLNTAFWPTFRSSDINLPSEMGRCLEVFNEFYSRIYNHRKLTWIYSLGTCDMIAKFDTKAIEISVTTCQAILLLLFNDHIKLSYEKIKAQLNLEDEYVMKLLHSVACGKYKILLKEPSSPRICTGDNFEFNPNFTHKLRKIRIPLAEVDEKKKTIKKVTEGRCEAIDAAILRIMKARKVLPQEQLLTECVEQLQSRFKPHFKAMKQRIDVLISRDFLEREESSNLLKYLP